MGGYQYTYFIGVFLALIVWVFLFIRRKDTRKEMLYLSLIFGIPAPLIAYVHLSDWWSPTTIMGTPVGIEDFLFGFVMGGIASVIYGYFFNKGVKLKRANKKIKMKKNVFLILFVSLSLVIFLAGFYIFNLNTFIVTLLGFGIPTIIMYIKRPDLIKDSIFSGILLLIFAFIGYQILNLITPGFFNELWLFENVGQIIFLKIPLEEYIWYFCFGLFMGPVYEFAKEGKLVDRK